MDSLSSPVDIISRYPGIRIKLIFYGYIFRIPGK